MPATKDYPVTPERDRIHYWKCDRKDAFHGTRSQGQRDTSTILSEVSNYLSKATGSAISLEPAHAQGNHITARGEQNGCQWFARIEDGPEGDAYMEVETHILHQLRELGLPVPKVGFCDASREGLPYAVQLIEYLPHPDLNQLVKAGKLQPIDIAEKIGQSIASWQSIQPDGFGPMQIAHLRASQTLRGWHKNYADYFLLNLDSHLNQLLKGELITSSEADRIGQAFQINRALLKVNQACLVHKDLALWNMLGTADGIEAFIDWDDAIGGDPMDDLSLLACFYGHEVVQTAFDGYASIRPLPSNYLQRFWMHWLRNMIIKSVIRVGAGYFNHQGGLFLMGANQSGEDFKRSTRQRLLEVLVALETNRTELQYEC